MPQATAADIDSQSTSADVAAFMDTDGDDIDLPWSANLPPEERHATQHQRVPTFTTAIGSNSQAAILRHFRHYAGTLQEVSVGVFPENTQIAGNGSDLVKLCQIHIRKNWTSVFLHLAIALPLCPMWRSPHKDGADSVEAVVSKRQGIVFGAGNVGIYSPKRCHVFLKIWEILVKIWDALINHWIWCFFSCVFPLSVGQVCLGICFNATNAAQSQSHLAHRVVVKCKDHPKLAIFHHFLRFLCVVGQSNLHRSLH